MDFSNNNHYHQGQAFLTFKHQSHKNTTILINSV